VAAGLRHAAQDFQAEGLIHTSPGQRPGFIVQSLFGCRPTACFIAKDESRLQRLMGFWADEPRALPWAGMSDAVGVSAPRLAPRLHALSLPHDLGTALPSKNPARIRVLAVLSRGHCGSMAKRLRLNQLHLYRAGQ